MSQELYRYSDGAKRPLEQSATHVGIRCDKELICRIMGEKTGTEFLDACRSVHGLSIIQLDQITVWKDALQRQGLLCTAFAEGRSVVVPRPFVLIEDPSEQKILRLCRQLQHSTTPQFTTESDTDSTTPRWKFLTDTGETALRLCATIHELDKSLQPKLADVPFLRLEPSPNIRPPS